MPIILLILAPRAVIKAGRWLSADHVWKWLKQEDLIPVVSCEKFGKV